MILEIYGLLIGMAFGMFGFGYWIRSKGLMFAGATIMIIAGSFNFLPTSVGGGVMYKTGYTQDLTNATFYVFSDTVTYIPSNVNGWLGLILFLLAAALMFGTFFADFDEDEA